MLKILFNRDTYEILGIHCFGDRASEIIHIGQAIMNQKGDVNTIEFFVNNTFKFPTMDEATMWLRSWVSIELDKLITK